MNANPKAERDANTIREAFELVQQLRNAGFGSGGYDLAPSFGGKPFNGQRLRSTRTDFGIPSTCICRPSTMTRGRYLYW